MFCLKELYYDINLKIKIITLDIVPIIIFMNIRYFFKYDRKQYTFLVLVFLLFNCQYNPLNQHFFLKYFFNIGN